MAYFSRLVIIVSCIAGGVWGLFHAYFATARPSSASFVQIIGTYVQDSSDIKLARTVGSGVILDKSGKILSALHLFQPSEDMYFYARTSAGQVYLLNDIQAVDDTGLAVAWMSIDEQFDPNILPIADPQNNQPFQDAWLAGFTPDGVYFTKSDLAYRDQVPSKNIEGKELRGLLRFRGTAPRGLSGGALIDRKGNILGILQASGKQHTYYTHLTGLGF